ncbi:MAG: hypothetical protein CMJ29_07625 [Phycisphaerae bacterium]|nr:hypothetical protein [Phycisphaerae bacterium]|tara:strand:+ start:2647 stop:2964 length:318 start_codon:yes stop_codon:yes gene_type:complete
MIHDQSMPSGHPSAQLEDRRRASREPTEHELVIKWHHDPRQNIRYQLVNESRGGSLIVSSVPLFDGMVGTVLARIPARGHRSSSVIVAWSRSVDEQWHVGLRYLT